VPIERTTLRGVKVFAAIAGMDLLGPAKQHDAIWHFFFKVRGRGTEPKFKAEQVHLAVVIDHEDFVRVNLRKEELNGDAAGVSTPKVSEYNLVLLTYHLLLCPQ
jgi:hypothetical protein